jgi:hypothetical protein
VERSGDRIQVGARFSTPVQTDPGAYSTFCTMGTESFLGVEIGRGVTLTLYLFTAEVQNQIIALLLFSLRAFVTCKKGEAYIITRMYFSNIEVRFSKFIRRTFGRLRDKIYGQKHRSINSSIF